LGRVEGDDPAARQLHQEPYDDDFTAAACPAATKVRQRKSYLVTPAAAGRGVSFTGLYRRKK
jgi:hypothetical protein